MGGEDAVGASLAARLVGEVVGWVAVCAARWQGWLGLVTCAAKRDPALALVIPNSFSCCKRILAWE